MADTLQDVLTHVAEGANHACCVASGKTDQARTISKQLLDYRSQKFGWTDARTIQIALIYLWATGQGEQGLEEAAKLDERVINLAD